MNSKEKEKKEKEIWLKEMGLHIRKMRIEQGFTGVEFAFRLNMDKPNLTRIEKGRVNPSLYFIKKVCEVLEISLKDFFEELK